MKWNFLSSSSSSQGAEPSRFENGSSLTSSTPTVPTLTRFERALKEEEKYQDLQYPSFEDVPGCMRLFDEFMMCYALVPQLRNIYRKGELHDCTYKFDDFKYCMSLKSETHEERRKLWVRRKAEWWAARRAGVSSEDVWEARTTPLENFPPLVPEDSEMNA